MNEKVIVRGTFSIKVIENATGKLLEDYTDNNLVVTLGKTNVCKLLGGAVAGVKISKIAVGTGITDPAVTDTTLTGLVSKAIDSATYPDDNSVLFSWTLGTGDANGITITEFGLLNDNNVLCARKVRSGIVKTSAISIVGSWKIFVN